jgi:hypothetical protein
MRLVGTVGDGTSPCKNEISRARQVPAVLVPHIPKTRLFGSWIPRMVFDWTERGGIRNSSQPCRFPAASRFCVAQLRLPYAGNVRPLSNFTFVTAQSALRNAIRSAFS